MRSSHEVAWIGQSDAVKAYVPLCFSFFSALSLGLVEVAACVVSAADLAGKFVQEDKIFHQRSLCFLFETLRASTINPFVSCQADRVLTTSCRDEVSCC